ncbi:hypothetical protein OB920_00300 [Halobacteria archaeon HArc-gm2]|nr:hypothetical protein [Halobacteria archaeon HArc-gm2]
MGQITALDAFRYATSGELLKLYAVAVVGGICSYLSAIGLVVAPLPVKLFALVIFAVGATLLFGGLLGALYKVLTDSRSVEEA